MEEKIKEEIGIYLRDLEELRENYGSTPTPEEKWLEGYYTGKLSAYSWALALCNIQKKKEVTKNADR